MALGWRKEYLRYKQFFLNIVALYKRNQDLKMFLEVLLSLATISFFTFFALKPTLVTIADLYKEIQAKEETVSKMDQKIQNVSTAQSVYEGELSRIPLTQNSVPNTPIPEIFARQIEGLAVTNGLNLLGVSVGQVTLVGVEKKIPAAEGELQPLPEGARTLSFSVSVTGAYPQLSKFLLEMEGLRRPIKIDNVGLTASQTEEGKKLVLLVSGRVPYLGKE
jgi:hypothetical protein